MMKQLRRTCEVCFWLFIAGATIVAAQAMALSLFGRIDLGYAVCGPGNILPHIECRGPLWFIVFVLNAAFLSLLLAPFAALYAIMRTVDRFRYGTWRRIRVR
jgi:hypothetical protein